MGEPNVRRCEVCGHEADVTGWAGPGPPCLVCGAEPGEFPPERLAAAKGYRHGYHQGYVAALRAVGRSAEQVEQVGRQLRDWREDWSGMVAQLRLDPAGEPWRAELISLAQRLMERFSDRTEPTEDQVAQALADLQELDALWAGRGDGQAREELALLIDRVAEKAGPTCFPMAHDFQPFNVVHPEVGDDPILARQEACRRCGVTRQRPGGEGGGG